MQNVCFEKPHTIHSVVWYGIDRNIIRNLQHLTHIQQIYTAHVVSSYTSQKFAGAEQVVSFVLVNVL